MLIIAIVASRMMVSSASIIEETSKQNILALSRAAALLVTAEEMELFVKPEDGKTPEYVALSHQLADFNDISGSEYTYFMRLDTETNMMQFIIDNSLLEDMTGLDMPLVPREPAPDIALSGIANAVELGSYSEGWEGYMTAFAPVYYKDGSISNIIAGVDMLDVNIRAAQLNMSRLSLLLIVSIIIVLGACFYSLILYQRQANQALLASDAKSSFLSNTSHEIRTPMNAILGMVDLIMHEDASDIVLSHATDIRNACRGLLTVINDILDISKIESGKLEIVPAKYQVSSLLSDSISIVKMRTDEKKLTLAVEIDSNIPSELIGDDLRIKQILVNLLNNAVKFTPDGQITLSVSCQVDDDMCQLFFSVADTGIGIKPEDLDKIFVLFQQVDTRKNRNIEGTGLGLSISNQLVEMMGGHITVESEYGVGSTFTASIMQKVASAQPITHLKNPERSSVLLYENRPAYLKSLTFALESLGCKFDICTNRSEMYLQLDEDNYDYVFVSSMYINNIQPAIARSQPGAVTVVLDGTETNHGDVISISMPIHCLQISNILNDEYADITNDSSTADLIAPEARVLVVDDNAVNLKVAAGLLKIYRILADTATGGVSAVEMIKQHDYDLVFMDHMMPDMDGIDTTVAIRALDDKYAKLPIVALTANAVGGVREMFKAEGLNDFLAKPIEISQMTAILKKWIPIEKQGLKPETPALEPSPFVIAGLDTRRGITNSGGTVDAYNEILAVYASDCSSRLRDMQVFHSEGDIKALTISVHAIKSASANIGAESIAVTAAELEAAGKAGDIGYINMSLNGFFTALTQQLDNIRSYLSSISQEDIIRDKPADIDFLRTSLTEISYHMGNLEIDAAENVLEELFTFQWDDEVIAQINKIKECIDIFDYDGTATAIEELSTMICE